MKVPALLLALLLVGSGSGVLSAVLLSEPSLLLRVSRQLCLTPCPITATITVARAPGNRALVVQIDGPTFQRSTRPIAGERGPRVLQIAFDHLSAGVYELTAVLYGTTGEVSRAALSVEVHGP